MRQAVEYYRYQAYGTPDVYPIVDTDGNGWEDTPWTLADNNTPIGERWPSEVPIGSSPRARGAGPDAPRIGLPSWLVVEAGDGIRTHDIQLGKLTLYP
jgi:hypothetical protein